MIQEWLNSGRNIVNLKLKFSKGRFDLRYFFIYVLLILKQSFNILYIDFEIWLGGFDGLKTSMGLWNLMKQQKVNIDWWLQKLMSRYFV